MKQLMSILSLLCFVAPVVGQQLPGTEPLTTQSDLAAQMVAGIDRYLMRELAASIPKREDHWKSDVSSEDALLRSVQPNRDRLARILGVVDRRVPAVELEFVATSSTNHLAAEGDSYRVRAVRWPVLEGIDAEGLFLEPTGNPIACVVALPDAAWTPEMLVGLAPGVPREAQFARRLAENGCQVLVPTLIDRQDTWSGNPDLNRHTNQPHREFIYRMAFEMGRHIIGYEVQKVLAAVTWFSRFKNHPPIGVFGYGEGGLLALYSGALDPRIQVTAVSGYFGPREEIWREPIYRNVWRLLSEFGDAEVVRLIAPRQLIVEASNGPEVAGPPPSRSGRGGAAPGKLASVPATAARRELERARTFFAKLPLHKQRGADPARIFGQSPRGAGLATGGQTPGRVAQGL
jgi:hypothetical protein